MIHTGTRQKPHTRSCTKNCQSRPKEFVIPCDNAAASEGCAQEPDPLLCFGPKQHLMTPPTLHMNVFVINMACLLPPLVVRTSWSIDLCSSRLLPYGNRSRHPNRQSRPRRSLSGVMLPWSKVLTSPNKTCLTCKHHF